MKSIVKKALNCLGIEIKKSNQKDYNLDLYHKLYPKDILDTRPFFNIGAGNFYHPYWTNVDYYSDWYAANKKFVGINHDLFSLDPLQIENNTAKAAYTSHTIEHIKNNHAQYLFQEVFRILEPGGLFRITAPDMDLHYTAYKLKDFDFFYWKEWYKKEKDYKRIMINKPLSEASIEQLFLHRFATAATTLHIEGIENPISDSELNEIFNNHPYEEALDFCCNKCSLEIQKKYPGNHTNWWNRQKVMSMLEKSGFRDIKISGYGQSECSILRNTSLFDNTHPRISFYIEAKK